MKNGFRVALFLAPLAFSGAAQSARVACERLEPGQFYPWQTNERMPGDKWAELLIKIDPKGRPLDCRIAKSNVDSEMAFSMCQAMIRDGHFEPIIINGKPEIGFVTKTILFSGRTHVRADDAARKRYFATHPEESPSCYPQ